ncbi:MAG: DUF1800 family protein, partial [bacterium]
MTVLRILAVSLVCATLAAADRPSAVPTNPDAETILHVLNRIGYGPRSGDVERVRSIGLAAYIDQQLHPERLADAGMNARLAGFDTLAMSTSELAERYFIPAMMERRERQRTRASQGEPGQPSQPDEMTPEMRREQLTGAMQEERAVLMELGQQRLLRVVYSERQLNEV